MSAVKVESRTFRIATGHELHRDLYAPPTKPVGGVVMVHGLGDYMGRYKHLAEFFCSHGLVCSGIDLPGHGRSTGQRGHIPSFELLANLLDHEAGSLRERFGKDLPLGLFAHSMGGYVALDYLPRTLTDYQFAWLSSPLIRPSANVRPGLMQLARIFGRLVPRLPFRTGVRAEDCRLPDPVTGLARIPDPHLHRRVSAGFGTQMILREQAITQGVQDLHPHLRLLVTHGTEDRVCLTEYSRALYDSIPLENKRFVEVHGSLHEPLHDHPERVFAEAAKWLEGLGYPLVDAPVVEGSEAASA